ncbi:MAG: hypothetical protein H0V89_14310 [Deltaproteobacteria bacterium]|nr:hypothetical protein [Deltaproteobacteria bacterium]
MGATSREIVARNFVERYGPDRLRQLLALFAAGESGQVIAEQFAVSRERVRQWKNSFGQLVSVYQVHPEVEAVIRGG